MAADSSLAAVIYRAMVAMGYDAAGIGILEAGLGPDVHKLADEAKLPLVGRIGPGVGEAQPGHLVRPVGALKVGVVSAAWVPAPDEEAYRTALRKELEAARAESDFVVLLSQLGETKDQEILSSPGFENLADVLVGGSVVWPQDQPVFLGRTLVLPGTTKGREVGVLEVELTDRQTRYHHQLVSLEPDLPADPTVDRMVDEYYLAHQELPQTIPMAAAADEPPLPEVFTPEEARATRARGHLTAPECGKCHERELKQWQGTPHAQAFRTLVKAGRTVGDCLVCHSEAARRSVPYDPAGADQWGVDCAACHGAGLYHTSTNGERDTIVARPGEAVCRRCHTEERDAGFEYRKRLEPVVH